MPRARVRIENGTVVTDQSELLRGGAAWVYGFGDAKGFTSYAYDPAYYTNLAAHGVNAVRLVAFDPWQRSHGYEHYDYTTQEGLSAFLAAADRVVELAGQAGLYVMVNYHDVGTYDIHFARAFWEAVAPRFANQTHVFYELLNEPVEWYSDNYTAPLLAHQEELYKLVRRHAPDTHVVMLTFANTIEQDSSRSMPAVASELRGIDWSNASVGFHLYRTGGTSAPIVRLREQFAVICTEVSLPRNQGGPQFVEPMDGQEWATETLEGLGVSWFAWSVDGAKNFQRNFVEGFLKDAQAKGYSWVVEKPETGRGRWFLKDLRAELAGLPIRTCARVMGLRGRHVAALVSLTVVATILDIAMLFLLIPMMQGAATGDFTFLGFWQHLGYVKTLLALAVLAFLLGLLRNLAIYASSALNSRYYSSYSRNLSLYVFERYLSFGKSYFDRRDSGHLNSLIDSNHSALDLFQTVRNLIATTILLAGYFGIMVWISWRITAMTLLLLPVMSLASRWVTRRTKAIAADIRKNDRELGSKVWQMLSALTLFRSFAREDEVLAHFRQISEARRRNSHRMWRAQAVSLRMVDIATLTAVLAMLASAFVLEAQGPAQMTRLLVFFFVARLAMPELAKFQEAAIAFAEKLPGARDFATIFSDEEKYFVPDGKSNFTDLKQSIEFRNLTFFYPDSVAPALSCVNFRIEKGKMTALVGTSGSGKSTLTNLLLRFYDAPPGTILIDGVDIREFTAASLRRKISVVSQHVMLLDRSLRDNILFGAEDESPERLARAVADADLGDVVRSLAKGLETPLGDGGWRLSGGQRQRVALARALAKGAPILVLDEATSSLDSATEARIQTAVDRTLAGVTSLVIAHRLSTIRKADWIVVLDQGRVAEQGTLAQLLENRGLFHQMWEHQKVQ